METKPRALSASVLIDIAVIVVVMAAAMMGFWPVFGGSQFIRPAVVGLIAGLMIAWLGAWKRWPTIIVGGATIGAYFLLGSVAALWKNRPYGGIIPNVETLRVLTFGSVGVWKQFITVSIPLGNFTGMTLVPFMISLVGAVVLGTTMWRTRRPALVLLPVSILMIGTIALGTSQSFYPVVIGSVIAGVTLGWITWRVSATATVVSQTSAAAMKRSRVAKAGFQFLVAAVVVGLVSFMLPMNFERQVLRKYVPPPLDTHSLSSPLVSFRYLVDERAEDTLFVVEGWEKDYYLRLAVMDSYDGMVYNVGEASGASRYDRVGPSLGGKNSSAIGKQVDITITVDNYTGVWVPSVATMDSLEFTGKRATNLSEELYYNPKADALINTAALGSGVSYTITSTVSDAKPTVETPVIPQTMPKPAWVPDKVGSLATQWAGTEKSVLTRVEAITSTFQSTGYFSHGLDTEEPSNPGHSSYRIAQLLDRPERMIGDDEQYAVAAALMLTEAGIPARVVMGFIADDESQLDGSTWTVTGSDAHAWVEVPFEGVGWYPFFPTPDKDDEPMEQEQRARAKPKPQVLQPPPPADTNDMEPSRTALDPRDDEDDKKKGINWAGILRIVAMVTIPLAILIAPIAAIILVKTARTKRRRTTPDLSVSVAQGWQEMMDHAADYGFVVPPTATRVQISTALRRNHGIKGLDRLAVLADRGTFAPNPPTPQEAAEFWATVDTNTEALAQGFPTKQRLLSRVSLTSLLPHPKPNVEIQE
ncbi:MAG: DUF3488 and transglutaminase-like domain-containing protein [Propionibacteriaceae bacterium]|nr:DUF3488 and transglutaminase-like domain-containing protein [Propionibacteriaceae bacterium]